MPKWVFQHLMKGLSFQDTDTHARGTESRFLVGGNRPFDPPPPPFPLLRPLIIFPFSLFRISSSSSSFSALCLSPFPFLLFQNIAAPYALKRCFKQFSCHQCVPLEALFPLEGLFYFTVSFDISYSVSFGYLPDIRETRGNQRASCLQDS